MATLTEARLNLEGLTIGDRYVARRFIGGDDIGEVWQAIDSHLGTAVAIKLISSVPTDESEDEWADYVQRFQQEAQTSANVKGAHVVQIIDCGELQGLPFIVMDYVRGTTLEKEKEAGPFSVEDAVHVLGDVLDGLASMHRVGVIYRNIKPTNIMHDVDGRYRLTDFVLAKSLSPDAGSMTSAGISLPGDPLYMPPEMFIPDGRSAAPGDLYSAGVLCWELLAGRNPLAGPAHENTNAQAMRRPQLKVPFLGGVRADVPDELSRFVERLTQLDPDERPANAMEALKEYQQVRDILTYQAVSRRLAQDPAEGAEASEPEETEQPAVAPIGKTALAAAAPEPSDKAASGETA